MIIQIYLMIQALNHWHLWNQQFVQKSYWKFLQIIIYLRSKILVQLVELSNKLNRLLSISTHKERSNNNSMEKRLDLPTPIISYSPSLDSYLSVIATSSRNIRPWLCENFIDIVYKTEPNVFHCEFLDMMHHVWINTPFLECSLLDRGLIDVTIQDLSSFLCTLIDNDYYILLTVNTFFCLTIFIFSRISFAS